MSVELSEEQRRALEARPDEPLRLIDPRTQQAYVLVRADLFESLQGHQEEEGLADTYPAQVESALRAGWGDPAMDDYDNYDKNFHKLRL
jgi:hypothetical protein